jgi:hypothetical protein
MRSGESRVWLFADGYGPGKSKLYLGWARIGDPTYGFGDVDSVEVPDADSYNKFDKVSEIQGAEENPTASIISRYARLDVSELLKAGKKRCPVGVQAHIGLCSNPQDFNRGWDKIVNFVQARFTSWSAENFGALDSDEMNPTNETGELSARDMYEIKKIKFTEICAARGNREFISVDVCDDLTCGECGVPSDGCQKVLAVMLGTGATPGTLPSVVYSDDGGTTCDSVDIDTLYSNEDPDDAACVGPDFVVISSAGGMHIATVGDILDGAPDWVETTEGFVAGFGPNCIWSYDARHTWIGAENGYIYFTSSPRSGVEIQDAAVATTVNILDIHACDSLHVVAVGQANAVIYTENGGETWVPIVGPSIGVQLNCVWMLDPNVWLIGDNLGNLWYTEDGGENWAENTDIDQTLTVIDEIEFHDETVGYMSARVGATDGRIFRTIDGGMTWYEMPEGTTGQLADNDRINSLAVCKDPNIVWGAGLNADGTTGFMAKAS